MRVVAGKARGTKLKTPAEDMPVRPTSDRVKEALFSAVQFDICGEVLDLFAGSGQLGIEALSRGADFAVFCDHEQRSIDLIAFNVGKVHMEAQSEIRLTDYKRYLRHDCHRRFHLVLIDPPYGTGFSDRALSYVAEGTCLDADAVVAVECPADEKKPERVGVLALYRRYTYGTVSFAVYRRESGTDESHSALPGEF